MGGGAGNDVKKLGGLRADAFGEGNVLDGHCGTY